MTSLYWVFGLVGLVGGLYPSTFTSPPGPFQPSQVICVFFQPVPWMVRTPALSSAPSFIRSRKLFWHLQVSVSSTSPYLRSYDWIPRALDQCNIASGSASSALIGTSQVSPDFAPPFFVRRQLALGRHANARCSSAPLGLKTLSASIKLLLLRAGASGGAAAAASSRAEGVAMDRCGHWFSC